MERFGRVLREVDRELEVREPERSRILLELAVDLEELYRAYRRRGCSEEEAHHRAEAWLAPDGASLDALRRLHAPFVGRLLDALSGVARSRVETAAFTVLALVAVAGALGGLRGTAVLWPPGPAAAGVLVLGGLGLGVAALRTVRLVLGPGGAGPSPVKPGGASRPGPPSDVSALLVLAAGSAVVGVLGASLELGDALGEASSVAASPLAGEAAAGSSVAAVADPRALWSAGAAAAGTAALGLSVALVLSLAWFWLAVRARRVLLARAELLEIAPSLDLEADHREAGGRSP